MNQAPAFASSAAVEAAPKVAPKAVSKAVSKAAVGAAAKAARAPARKAPWQVWRDAAGRLSALRIITLAGPSRLVIDIEH